MNEKVRTMQSFEPTSVVTPACRPEAGFGVLDRELRFLEVDQTLARIHGVPASRHPGQPLAAILPSMVTTIAPLVRQVLSTGTPILEAELQGTLPSGSGCRWLASYYPVRTRTGSVLAVECVIRPLFDDTPPGALIIGEERSPLTEAAAILEALLAAAPVGVAILDRRLRFVQINQRMAALNGLSEGEHLGHTACELLPELAPVWEAYCQRVLDTGEPVVDVALRELVQGVVRQTLVSYIPVRAGCGTILGILVVVRDTTEQKLTEAALQRLCREAKVSVQVAEREWALSEALIAAAPVGFAIVDTDRRIKRINAPLARAAGLTEAEYQQYEQELRAQLHNDRLAAVAGLAGAYEPGRRLDEILPALARRIDPLVAHVLATAEPILDYELCAGEHEQVWRLSLFPVRSADGSLLGAGVVMAEANEMHHLAATALGA